jgi:fibronectin type 3 domain-containing protein
MKIAKRLAIALIALGCVLGFGFYFYPKEREQPSEPPRLHKVTLNWVKAPRAVSYNVYRRPYLKTSFTMIGSSTTTSYEDSGVESAGRYCYQVTSLDAKGREAPRSKEMCGTVPHP